MSEEPHRTFRRSGSRRLHALLAAIAVVAAACGGSSGSGPPDGSEADGANDADPSLQADRLPDEPFEMSDGTTATFADLTGRPLVVNFFASWCPPCRAEMPDFQEVHTDVGDEVRIVGFALADSVGAAQALVDETGVSFDWALDPEGGIYTEFGGFAMPTTVYVSADGEVLGRDNGPIDASTLRERIERHFGVTTS